MSSQCIKNGVYGAVILNENIQWFVGDLYKIDNNFYFVYDTPVTLEEVIQPQYLFDNFIKANQMDKTEIVSRDNWNILIK